MSDGEIQALLSLMNDAPQYPRFNPPVFRNKRVMYPALNGARVSVPVRSQPLLKVMFEYDRKVAHNAR